MTMTLKDDDGTMQPSVIQRDTTANQKNTVQRNSKTAQNVEELTDEVGFNPKNWTRDDCASARENCPQ